MKKLLLIIAFGIIGMNGFSQDALVKVSPFHFFDGTLYVSYEKALENNRSIQLDGGLLLADNGKDYGWMGELQLRKYLFSSKFTGKSVLSGFYAGLYVNGKYFKEYNEWREWNTIVEPYWDYVYNKDGTENWEESVWHQGEYEEIIVKESYDIKQGEGGVIFGFQTIIKKALSIDLFLGGGVRGAQIDGKKLDRFNGSDRGYTGVVPKGGFSLGITF